MNVSIISEDDFLKMIATRNVAQGLSSPAGKKVPTTPKSSHKATTSKNIKSEPEPVTTPTKKRSSPESKKIDLKPQASSSSTSPPKEASCKKDENNGNDEAKLPWVDKYKPTNLKQVIGKKKNLKIFDNFKLINFYSIFELQECTVIGVSLKNYFTG